MFIPSTGGAAKIANKEWPEGVGKKDDQDYQKYNGTSQQKLNRKQKTEYIKN